MLDGIDVVYTEDADLFLGAEAKILRQMGCPRVCARPLLNIHVITMHVKAIDQHADHPQMAGSMLYQKGLLADPARITNAQT